LTSIQKIERIVVRGDQTDGGGGDTMKRVIFIVLAVLALFTGQSFAGVNPPPVGVPEPATMFLVMAGLFGVGWARKKIR
jgi:hypothetical protein